MHVTTPSVPSLNSDTTPLPTRALQVDAASGKKPKIVVLMSDWQYLERSLHRLVTAWARHFCDWEDKRAVCRHVWEQAECVRRLRERLTEFPGTTGNLERPVSGRLEELANTVLLAPSHEDAVDGIYQLLTGALVRSYLQYVEHAHPVHDAPTIAMLQEIVRIKEGQRLWLRDYRRRRPHTTNAAYLAAVEAKLAACGEFGETLSREGAPAQPVGVNTGFRLPSSAGQPAGSERKHDFMGPLEADFTDSIEARRLFWCYGYLLEQNLADDQMRWLWDASDLPWEFIQDVSRHLWDESRHGDSGHSRLLDFGLTIQDVGFSSYGTAPEEAPGIAKPMSPEDLYEAVFFIGMCAETGHFPVKHEAYADFKAGGDLESAEMMLFDIIDETAHVQYAHRWLPVLAERAGRNAEDFKERGQRERQRLQEAATQRQAERRLIRRDPENPDYAFYQKLLAIMRDKQPLSNASTCPPRSFKPM